MKTTCIATIAATVVCLAAGRAGAACNLIPSAQTTFRGALGSTDRPFAGPGDFVEIRVRPDLCDTSSVGFSADAAEEVVTVVFTPPSGIENVIVIAHECGDLVSSCPGASSLRCIDADTAGKSPDVAVIERDGERRLLFRFPDTDPDVGAPSDRRTFTGPVRIAVKDRRVAAPNELVACELVSQRCADLGAINGLAACIDELFELDGTCRTSPAVISSSFGSFTALPPPNDFQQLCTGPSPPCLGTATEVRLTTDAAGNVYLPMNWQGVLVRQNDVPVPRLLRASTAQQALTLSSGPVEIPGTSFVASYTPEGAKLPPIFEPQFDPGAVNELTLFGSADAPHTILRASRRSIVFRECSNAVNRPCNSDSECPGAVPASCATATCCSDPITCGATPCSSDAACSPGEECGPSIFDFSYLYYLGTGPLLVPRLATTAGVCELDPSLTCPMPVSDCGAVSAGNCVDYRVEAQDPVPLEGIAATQELFTFAQRESDAGRDLNGDGDQADTVLVLRDRTTGEVLPIGGGGTDARALTQIRDGAFRFPAIAGQANVAAFLESEPLEGTFVAQDKNGDGDEVDTILRVFRVDASTPVDLLPTTNLAAAGAPLIDGHSVVVSNTAVFARVPESAGAARQLTRLSVDNSDNEITGGTDSLPGQSISGDGRFMAFSYDGTSLFLPDTNNSFDVFIRDRDTDQDGRYDEPGSVATSLVSYDSTATATANGSSYYPCVSRTGRFVAFTSGATNLVGGPASTGTQIYVRDRDTNTTVRVSVDANQNAGTGGNSGGQRTSVSADGRYVAFDSMATNLVAGDTNGQQDVFVHDRDVDGDLIFDEVGQVRTIRISVAADGEQGDRSSGAPSMTPDGRFVAFQSEARNLVPDDGNNAGDVFVHDRDADGDGVFDETAPGAISVERVSVDSRGHEGERNLDSSWVSISDDGSHVAFGSAADLAADGSDPGGVQDVFLRNRNTGTTQTISLTSGDNESGGNLGAPSMSADGLQVTMQGIASVASNPNSGPAVYMRDLVTSVVGIVSVNPVTGQGNNASVTSSAEISADGRWVTFGTAADNLVAGDSNGRVDYFAYGTDIGDNDLSGDGIADDTILYNVDASTGPPATVTALCPAEASSATAGLAAFLRPEPAGQTPSLALCPTGPLVGNDPDLNGDGDAGDAIVHLWRGSGNVDNLHCAATALVLSDQHLAALVSEADQGDGPLNGDGLADDQVLKVYDLGDPNPASCGDWTTVPQAADAVQIAGDWVAFTTPESAQQVDLNGDGDQLDRVLQLYNTNTAMTTNLQRAVEEFVLGATLLAYRASETSQSADLNGDGDQLDDVMLIYDLVAVAPAAAYLPQAVRPCRLEACDPRLPYRVFSNSVKFLTFECDQGGSEKSGCPGKGTDLNNDGTADDLVIQTFNVVSGQTKVVGTVAPPSDTGLHSSQPDPTLGDPLAPADGGTEVFISSGRCVEELDIGCNPSVGDCPNGAACVQTGNVPSVGLCYRDHGVCANDADCPPKVDCLLEPIVPASADEDADGIPDVLDNCPSTSNTDQIDVDDDAVGDACDLQLCGNGVIEVDEPCDGAANATCSAPCLPNCTCDCSNYVNDPRARVSLSTKRDAGKLTVKMELPLSSYNNEPVGVRLADSDSVIASRNVGVLTPRGNNGDKWEYKIRDDGLRKIALHDLGSTLLVKVSAKRWFSAAKANEPAGTTRVIITIGNQCFVHTATRKVD